MNTDEIEKMFWSLCEEVNHLDSLEVDADVPDLEPSLLAILNYVKNNSQFKQLFINCFIKIANGEVESSEWILLFCMRELRYPEVRKAANLHFEHAGGRYGAPRLMNWLSNINHVYEDTLWKDADFFEYYWNKEHPNEPWPCA